MAGIGQEISRRVAVAADQSMADTQTIYVALLNERTDVWRPVSADRLNDGAFRVLGPIPDDEEWEFPPGAVVTCERHTFRDGSQKMVAVAVALID